jgi:hypothetical protein
MKQRSALPVALVLLLLTTTTSLPAQDEAPAKTPQVTIEAITIEPPAPAADTLCKLTVTLKNHGTEVASQLDFKVEINGRMLPVYRNQLFMFPLAAGATSDLKLYNFWSTETSRPFPEDGKLKVEVSLVGAQWTKVTMEEETEVWQPLGDVEGLPHAQSVTLEMKR